MNIASDLVTIVIPTRNRFDLLEPCVRSVFESQVSVPVIVSDNSTKDDPRVDELRARYGFTYIRQSGNLTATEHFNACLELPQSKWIWMVHDDDELCAGAIAKVAETLAECHDVGIVVGAVRNIDLNGNKLWDWIPSVEGVLEGEAALLRLGLDFGVFSPTSIFRLDAARGIGGFIDIRGYPADYTFTVSLAYKYGLLFLQDIIGRCRYGPHQDSNVAKPELAQAWLDFGSDMSQEIARRTGCSVSAGNQLLDYMTWYTFGVVMPRWLDSHPEVVFAVCRNCLRRSPAPGQCQREVRATYPFLFWRPLSLAVSLYRVRRFLRPLKRALKDLAYTVGKVTPTER